MNLASGTRLGPYEIIDLLGRGGMGEVYRARDARLGREVAIKVADETFNERFEREARVAASLNHLNICTLHDVGPNYLVMEVVDGPTLADRIKAGPIPLDEALGVARQIADALEAAHDKGVVHRDLKPGNIKIKADGTVKVLDFGLAKLGAGEAGRAGGAGEAGWGELTNSPTLNLGATQAGMILGTAAYMSPEQARGKAVDKRADIWAFGAVLYEMLTGKKAFEGEDVSTILAAVIQTEPRLEIVPGRVRRLIRSCLEKDPKKRLRDVGDAWKLLDEPATAAPAPSTLMKVGWVAAAALAAVAVVALWAPWRRVDRPPDRPLTRLEVDLGSDVSLEPLLTPTPSTVLISPDGTRFLYLARSAGGPLRLYTRRLDQTKAVELGGTDGAASPFFSPDGRWVAFFDGRKLKKISVDGGAAVPLGEFNIFAGASWGDDDNLVVGSGLDKGVLRLSSKGGVQETVLELGGDELFHSFPQVLPGAKAALIAVYGTPPGVDKANIEVFSFADRRRKTLVRGATSPRYLMSGHLVYTNRNTMFAIPFDLDTLETRGTAVPVLDDVAFDASASFAQFDVSRGGTLVYRRTPGAANAMTLQWLDATGKQTPLAAKAAVYSPPRLSPDGKRVLMVSAEGTGQDVWVYDEQRDAMTRLTFGGGAYVNPAWSPDGQYVVIGSIGNGIFWTRADGAGQPQVLVAAKSLQFPGSFTPDGKRLTYQQVDGSPQVWTVPIEDDGGRPKAGKPEPFIRTQFSDTNPVFSPDGRWIAYQSNESGTFEVYVRAFPAPASGLGGKWQISNSGGTSPVWSRAGRELMYRAGDRVMSVSYIVNGDSFVADKPRVWAEKLGGASGFDLSPDGKRLIVTIPVATSQAPTADHHVVFVLNFFDELRRRVPVAK
jgi:serine/threonine-protein kinase